MAKAAWALFLCLIAAGLLGGGVPAAVIAFGQRRPEGLSQRLVLVMAVLEILIGAMDIAVGRYTYREATRPGAGEGGLLTGLFGLIGVVGLVIGPLLVLAGVLQLAEVRAAIWLQWLIVGLYLVMFVGPVLFVMM